MPDGQALYLSGSGYRYITLAPHFAHPRWQTALAAAPGRIVDWGPPDTHPGGGDTHEQAARAAHPAHAGRVGRGRPGRHPQQHGQTGGGGAVENRALEHDNGPAGDQRHTASAPGCAGRDGFPTSQPDGRGLSAGREGATQ